MGSKLEKLGVDFKKFTPTEKNIIRFMEDGNRHHRQDIKQVLFDTEVSDRTLSKYISVIRTKLEDYRIIVLCEYYRHRFYYRMVLPVNETAQVR